MSLEEEKKKVDDLIKQKKDIKRAIKTLEEGRNSGEEIKNKEEELKRVNTSLAKEMTIYKDKWKMWVTTPDWAKIAPMGASAVYFWNNASYVHQAGRTLSTETVGFDYSHYQILSEVITGKYKL